MSDRREVVGILLGGGKSTRFGTDKLLHPLPDGTPIALASALAMGRALARFAVVVRPDHGALAELLRANGIQIISAPEASQGMGASLARGVRELSDATGWVIGLADMPFIRPRTIAAVGSALEDGAELAAPLYRGRRGHPVGFSSRYREALLGLSGDEGGKALLRDGRTRIRLIECDDPGVGLDIDTVADLAAVATVADPGFSGS